MTEALQKKVTRSIRLIQVAGEAAAQHGQPLEICYSCGKDSDVILELAKMSGVNYRAIYKNTTIDPPGTTKHAKEKGVEVLKPAKTFMQLIKQKGYPSRNHRFCCDVLKEYKIYDYAVIGVRRDESNKRSKYQEPTVCRAYKKDEETELFMPLLDWTADNVSEFISERGIKCHPLYYDYDGNFHVERRLGCIGCPLASRKKRIAEMQQYPGIVRLYVNAGQKYLDTHPQVKNNEHFKDAAEMFVFTLYCDSLVEFQQKFGSNNLFGEKINCKEFLETKFGIKL